MFIVIFTVLCLVRGEKKKTVINVIKINKTK